MPEWCRWSARLPEEQKVPDRYGVPAPSKCTLVLPGGDARLLIWVWWVRVPQGAPSLVWKVNLPGLQT